MGKTIFVYENWHSENPALLGKLYSEFSRGRETFSFEYDNHWLEEHAGICELDPDLQLYSGPQYPPPGKSLFGVFTDSCPDRWGRILMRRKETIDAEKESREPRKLTKTDFLLGVFDESRMGALRFALEEGGDFLSNDKAFATPPWVNLRTLEHASIEFEQDEEGLGEQWLKELLAPGSSLGGARPKATVLAADGSLWIAKFPSKNDEHNSGAWEKVVHDLARSCGLIVPESKLETFSKAGSTFLVKRFDRDGKRRIHFSSAMTLLGKQDGASAADGSSYLDMLEFIESHGADPKADLPELWKRIVFNMAVSNTDDHLRNHGFILTDSGWRLSPLYDVNPSVYGRGLALCVDEEDSSLSVDLALSVAGLFGLNDTDAEKAARSICNTVKDNWVELAKHYGLNRNEIEYMRPAFSLEY